jgi:hypothetical protein
MWASAYASRAVRMLRPVHVVNEAAKEHLDFRELGHLGNVGQRRPIRRPIRRPLVSGQN